MNQEINPVEFGIEPVKAKEMLSGLSVIMEEREALKLSYIDVIKLPITEENVSIFKDLRIKVRDNRTKGIEPWHKTNKAFYLAGGRFVDAIKNKEVLENEQMEEKLLEGEKFFENQEKERLSLLKTEREAFLRPFVEVIPNGLEDLDQDVFDSFLETKKKSHLEKLETERLEAIKVEEARLAEIERQRLIEVENAKLKVEAELKEKIRKERGAKMQPYIVYIRDYNKLLEMSDADFEKEIASIHKGAMDDMKYQAEKIQAEENERIAQAKKERQEFEKATELRLKEEAVKKAREEKEKTEALAILEAEKLAKAPDKDRLIKMLDDTNLIVSSFEFKTDKGAQCETMIIDKFNAFKKWAKSEIEKL